MDKIGRNDPCPCGSGKKYKRCCLASPIRDGLAAGFTVEDRRSALAKLKRFVERELDHEDGEARESFYGRWHDRLDELRALDSYWPDLSESVYAMWFYFDFELPTGGSVADLFLERNWQLSPGERQFIQALRQTAMRPYEVVDLSPGVSVTLKELLAATQVTVHERHGSRSMPRHSLIAARVSGRGASGLPEIEAGLIHIPELVRETVVSQLSAHREDYRREHPHSSDTGFYKKMALFFHEAWMSCLLEPPVPRLTNADGEDALITRIRLRRHRRGCAGDRARRRERTRARTREKGLAMVGCEFQGTAYRAGIDRHRRRVAGIGMLIGPRR